MIQSNGNAASAALVGRFIIGEGLRGFSGKRGIGKLKRLFKTFKLLMLGEHTAILKSLLMFFLNFPSLRRWILVDPALAGPLRNPVFLL